MFPARRGYSAVQVARLWRQAARSRWWRLQNQDADRLQIDPIEFCRLLKQVDRQPPRLSRDLEPDFIGIDIKQRILDVVIAAGPAVEEFERALLEGAATLDDIPQGAARGVCSDIMLEWRMAHASPHFLPWLREEAVRPPEPRKKRRADRERDGDFPERGDRPFFPPPPLSNG